MMPLDMTDSTKKAQKKSPNHHARKKDFKVVVYWKDGHGTRSTWWRKYPKSLVRNFIMKNSDNIKTASVYDKRHTEDGTLVFRLTFGEIKINELKY